MVSVWLLVVLLWTALSNAQCTTYSDVRATGDWTVAADNGQTPDKQLWDPAEPLGLMNLGPNCVYSVTVSHLVPGTSYQWKVTIGDSWDLNYGCPGENGPNCEFTAGSSGIETFEFNPDTTLTAVPVTPTSGPTGPTQAPGNGVKQVVAHFMVGNTYAYTQAHWASDIALAQSLGIDAFALNIGTGLDWSTTQILSAYTAAANTGFKLFISFDQSTQYDFNTIVNLLSQTANLPAQFKYNGRAFVSTFEGNQQTLGYSDINTAWQEVKNSLSSSGIDLFFVPFWALDPSTIFQDYPVLDGIFTWAAWPDPNTPASSLLSSDHAYQNAAVAAGKIYMAPVAPWFFTHLPAYSKNYLYDCETLWFDRWTELLTINPDIIEIVTFNDWGESHYIGPIDPNQGDLPDTSPDYVEGFPHDHFQDILPYFISAYKNGVAPSITQDIVVYYHMPFLKNSVASNDPQGPPAVFFQNTSSSGLSPSAVLSDVVYVITLLTSSATIQVNSGGAITSYSVPAGPSVHTSPINLGTQTVTLIRGSTVCSDTSTVSVGNNPVLYNYNVYVGGCKSAGSSSPPPPPPPTFPPPTSGYLGCFYDTVDARDLPYQADIPNDQVTVESCREYCGLRLFSYAGLQYSYQCFCGDSYGSQGQAANTDCDSQCAGNLAENCGGGNRNSIYTTTGGFLGCYVDSDTRDLPTQLWSSSTNTIESCKSGCANAGYTYAGLQYGQECWCGNSYGSEGSAPISDCQEVTCTGDATEYCGSGYRNAIFLASSP